MIIEKDDICYKLIEDERNVYVYRDTDSIECSIKGVLFCFNDLPDVVNLYKSIGMVIQFMEGKDNVPT